MGEQMYRPKLGTILVLVLLACAGVLALIFVNWSNNPAQGTIIKQEKSILASAQTERKPIATSYFEAILPVGYKEREKQEETDSAILGHYNAYTSKNNQNAQLSITIGKVEPDGLAGVPSVSFRRSRPAEYQVPERRIHPSSRQEFVSQTLGEHSVYIQSGTTYAAIVASGPTIDLATAYTDLIDLLDTWSWKQ
jgi:hypothetical protein